MRPFLGATKNSVQIIRARPEDADVLTQVAHAAKRHWGYPEHWIQAWSDALTMRPEFVASNIAFCAVDGQDLLGFYLLTKESDGLHLDHLWILPRAIRQGVGRALFKHAIEQTRDAGYRSLLIESDPNAEGFYLRMGARKTGVNVTSMEGERRELPLFVYDLD